ncbi:MAG: SWIM zinc finger family protein, partial [Chloroflexota bacterium]
MPRRSSGRWNDGQEWAYTGPRRPAHGIRAQTQRGAFGQTWWAGRWIAALERLVDPGRLSRGRSYARSGQVVQLDV